MFPRSLRRLGMALCTVLALFAFTVPLLALNVQPVIIDLLSAGRRASAIITLQNTFAETVPVEVTAHPIRVVNGELQEVTDEEAENLLIFPAQATIGGGQAQAFRVQWVGDPAPTASEHFYVTVSQLPVQLPENQNAIQVLHRFKVVVSVGAPDGRPALRVTGAEIRTDANGRASPVITVANDGNTYGYVGRGRMTLIQRGPNGEEVFSQTFEPEDIQRRMGLGLVPSGQTRILPLNVDLPQAGGTLSVELTPVPQS